MWQSNNGKLVYTQQNEIASAPDRTEDGQLNITQAVYNAKTDMLIAVTTEHNIAMHNLETMQLDKQVNDFNNILLCLSISPSCSGTFNNIVNILTCSSLAIMMKYWI